MSLSKKKYLLFTLVSIGLIASCSAPTTKILGPEKLRTQTVKIITDRDTSITLKGGTQIEIPKGSLVSNKREVSIEITEAITLDQMILGGLQTKSNGRLLSSAGMICIQPSLGEMVSIEQTIHIRVPAKTTNAAMKLYEGREDKSGIAWENPRELLRKPDTLLLTGEEIFNFNCSSCHKHLEEATGPPLFHSLQRWENAGQTKANMYQFVRNSAALIAAKNPYALCIYDKWYKTAMTCFPNLSDDELDAVFHYIEINGRKQLSGDSTLLDQPINENCVTLQARLNQKLKNLDTLNNIREPFLTINTENGTLQNIASTAPANQSNSVTPNHSLTEYYTIEINAFGWYNIDILTDNLPGVKASTLVVQVKGLNLEDLKVFLVIPSAKIFVQGGILDDGVSYGFKQTNGELPLPQGVQAIVFAVGEEKNSPQLYFGNIHFETKESQSLVLSVGKIDAASLEREIVEMLQSKAQTSIKKIAKSEFREQVKKDIKSLSKRINLNCGCQTVAYPEK
jgi:mono/diheme cytochrome c family protein